MNAPLPSRPAAEIAAHHLMLQVLRCKNATDRLKIQWTMKRPDATHMLVGCDWALERGFLKHGTTNASALVHNRWQGEQLYMTKAGKAWLRSFGDDFGSCELTYRSMRACSVAAADRAFIVSAVAA